MSDFSIKQFADQLLSLVNHCGLTPGTAYYILKDMTNQVERIYLEGAKQLPKEQIIEKQIEIPVQDKAD